MKDVKRICSLCGIDRTPLQGGIYSINDRQGYSLGLFGECCYSFVLKALDESPTRYGNEGREIRKNILERAKVLKRG